MAITTAMCTSFRQELLEAKHNFLLTGGDTFKLALIKDGMAGTYGKATTNYSDVTGNSDEASGTGYSAGGVTLTRVDPTNSSNVAFADFSDGQWTSATFSCRGCIIYNSTLSNAAVSVHDFGATKSVTNGTFDVTMPAADSSNAVLRLA